MGGTRTTPGALLATAVLALATVAAPTASAGHCAPYDLTNEVLCITLEWTFWAFDIAWGLTWPTAGPWVYWGLDITFWAVGEALCPVFVGPVWDCVLG